MNSKLSIFWLLAAAFVLLPGTLLAEESCLDCHRQQTPAAVSQWESSAHAGMAGCADCHGSDHAAIEAGEAKVDARVCGRCHEDAFHQHIGSRHGMGLHSGWGCTRNLPDRDPKECGFCHEEGSTIPISQVECSRFLKQSLPMREIGCNRCHQVEKSCASCHSNHLTDLAIVRDPGVCAKCHMGPDHPQWEMWQTSQHGTLFAAIGEEAGPTCQRCHMKAGTHDVSKGLTATPGMALYPEAELLQRRRDMVAICTECHGEKFVLQDLEYGDAIRKQSLAMVKEAEEILWDLYDRGLLVPMPEERPGHPLRGKTLVTDSQMLYEDISHIERLFFKMKKYDLAKTVKGAYHQNPAYTHWYGNAELKMGLADIKAEAARLKVGKGAGATAAAGNKSDLDDMEAELTRLKKRLDRGALTAEEYARRKKELLRRLSP